MNKITNKTLVLLALIIGAIVSVATGRDDDVVMFSVMAVLVSVVL